MQQIHLKAILVANEMLDMLKELEWAGTAEMYGELLPVCPSCDQGQAMSTSKHSGHKDDCKLQALIRWTA